MKIVINNCFGGFGLSHEATLRYFDIKGITVYPEQGNIALGHWTYWTTKPEDRLESKEGREFHNMSIEDRQAYNKQWSEQTVYERDIARNDPALVQVVEELGSKANGKYSELKVVDVPDNVLWHISEYDGRESVAENHRTWS